MLRPVPPLALIGFAIAWFGINHAGAAFIIAIGAFWINFYATYGGVEGVSEELLDVASEIFGVPGIGRRIFRAGQNLQVDAVIAYILVLSLMFLLVDTAFRAAQRRVLAWR